jgi:hypothetical protein
MKIKKDNSEKNSHNNEVLKLNLFQKHTAKLGLCANAKKAESEM